MIVCVDIGNAAVKMAAMGAEDTVVERAALPSAALGDAGAVQAALRALVSGGDGDVAGVAVASVVPGGAEVVSRAAEELWRDAGIVVVTASLPLPITLDVENPESVGADRICAAAGAVGASRPSAIVVDAGSAITVDRVIDLAFTGGAILPGPQMMLSALARDTGQLPRLALDELPSLFPRRPHPTPAAMAFGVGAATVGGILEAVRRLAPDLPVVVTGGHLGRLGPYLPDTWLREPDLVFRGLYRIAGVQDRS